MVTGHEPPFFPFHLSFERPSCTDSWLCPFFPLTIWQREALYGLGYCVSFLFHDTLCVWSLSCISFYLLIKFNWLLVPVDLGWILDVDLELADAVLFF